MWENPAGPRSWKPNGCPKDERFYPLFDGFMWIGVVVSFFPHRLWPILVKGFRPKASAPPS